MYWISIHFTEINNISAPKEKRKTRREEKKKKKKTPKLT